MNTEHSAEQIGSLTSVEKILWFSDKRSGSLQKRQRQAEDLLEKLLFSCGAISILITILLIVGLGSETLNFFTAPDVFRRANKAITQDIGAVDKVIYVEAWGARLYPGIILKVGEELMRVETVVDAETIVVMRGYNSTLPVEHAAETEIDVSRTASLQEFFSGTVWQPQIGEFGVLPLLVATLETSVIAMLVAVPLGLGTAIYLSEYASAGVRAWLKPIIELLAGIPTVVYGYFALSLLTPLLRSLLGENVVAIFNMGSAGIAIGLMIMPTISSISEDALSAVPNSLRQASYALGATRLETIFGTVLPAALSGVVAAGVVGFARAISEPIIVAVAAGAGPRLTLNPFEPAETIAGHITRIGAGDVAFDTIDYTSLFALGLTLFIITFVMNAAVNFATHVTREQYE